MYILEIHEHYGKPPHLVGPSHAEVGRRFLRAGPARRDLPWRRPVPLRRRRAGGEREHRPRFLPRWAKPVAMAMERRRCLSYSSPAHSADISPDLPIGLTPKDTARGKASDQEAPIGASHVKPDRHGSVAAVYDAVVPEDPAGAGRA